MLHAELKLRLSLCTPQQHPHKLWETLVISDCLFHMDGSLERCSHGAFGTRREVCSQGKSANLYDVKPPLPWPESVPLKSFTAVGAETSTQNKYLFYLLPLSSFAKYNVFSFQKDRHLESPEVFDGHRTGNKFSSCPWSVLLLHLGRRSHAEDTGRGSMQLDRACSHHLQSSPALSWHLLRTESNPYMRTCKSYQDHTQHTGIQAHTHTPLPTPLGSSTFLLMLLFGSSSTLNDKVIGISCFF